jgi:hypothetical protein
MVNVNRNIMPGKSSEKTEEKAPMRRPRNKALNSSKKLPESIKDRRKQKLNCSREEVINQLVNEEQIYTQEEAEELIDAFEERTGATVERLATIDEVDNYDGEFWATKDGVTQLWCRGNGGWYVKEDDYDSDGSLGVELADQRDNRGVNFGFENDKPKFDEESSPEMDGAKKIVEDWITSTNSEIGSDLAITGWRVDRNVDNQGWSVGEPGSGSDTILNIEFDDKARDSEGEYVVAGEGEEAFHNSCLPSLVRSLKQYLSQNVPEVTSFFMAWPGSYNEWDVQSANSSLASSKELNCAEDSEPKIMTESGNEISLSDIQIIQNPETNEISLFIKEDEDEEIPEGFVVIATATQPALPVEETEVEEVAEGDEELDSSKKKN